MGDKDIEILSNLENSDSNIVRRASERASKLKKKKIGYKIVTNYNSLTRLIEGDAVKVAIGNKSSLMAYAGITAYKPQCVFITVKDGMIYKYKCEREYLQFDNERGIIMPNNPFIRFLCRTMQYEVKQYEIDLLRKAGLPAPAAEASA